MLDSEQIWDRVERHWIMRNGPYIQPRFPVIRCPVCPRHDEPPFVQSWTFFRRSDPRHRMPVRIDVVLKCTLCSNVWVHGVAAPATWWEENVQPEICPEGDGPVKIHWHTLYL